MSITQRQVLTMNEQLTTVWKEGTVTLQGNAKQRRIQLRELKRKYSYVERYEWYAYAYNVGGLRDDFIAKQ